MSISRKLKIKLLIGLVILTGLLFLLNGCAFTHRGESSFGFLKDLEVSSGSSSTASFTRPARD